MARPRLFIGSSSEGKDVAYALQALLRKEADCVIWDQGVLGIGNCTLEALETGARNFDFAILVLTPDDLKVKREATAKAPRDNVIFEFGLFVGAIGRDRTYGVYCDDNPIDLPTDLAGITLASYLEHQDGMKAALGPAASDIQKAMTLAKSNQARPGTGYIHADLRYKLGRIHDALENIITFTQQISQELMLLIRNVDEMAERDLPVELRGDARLNYARGLYAIMRLAAEPEKTEHRDAALTFLNLARTDDKNPRGLRNSLIRLSQAYRQAGQLNDSRTALEELRNLSDEGAETLAIWGKALVGLQEGLATQDLIRRRSFFFEASEQMQGVFETRFGWDDHDDEIDEHEVENGSVAFYTAKAMWAYRCTFARDNPKGKFSPEFRARLQRASDLALRLYERGRDINAGNGNKYVNAIYQHCVAFTIAVRKALPEIDQTRAKKEVKNGRACLERADRLAKKLAAEATDLPRVIYVEGVERLGTFEEFQRDNSLVRRTFDNSQAIFDFYGCR